MKPGSRWAPLGCAVIVLLPVAQLPEVSQTVSGASLLRGLPGVAVVAEQVPSEVRALGLDEAWLERRVKAALERDSIPMLTPADAASRDRQPMLILRLVALRLPERGAFAWCLALGVHQRVRPMSGDSASALATTWEAEQTMGFTSAARLKRSVGASLEVQARQFVRAWKRRMAEAGD